MLYRRFKGRYDKEYEELWSRLVPKSGPAQTVQGELVRVIGKLASECYRNGNGNWDMGFRMFTNFLYKYLRDPAVFSPPIIKQIEQDISEIRAVGSGAKRLVYKEEEDTYDRVTDRVVEWCQHYSQPIKLTKNPTLSTGNEQRTAIRSKPKSKKSATRRTKAAVKRAKRKAT